MKNLLAAPILGSIHYGTVRLLINYGLKAATSSLNIYSYVLMHTIGNLFIVAIEKLTKQFQKNAGKPKSGQESGLKMYVMKVVKLPLLAAKKADYIYSRVFNIHTAKEAAKLRPRELSLTETLRKLFIEHIIEQAAFILSWEIGRHGAELLLKAKILAIIPSTLILFKLSIPFYVVFFFSRFVVRFNSFRDSLLEEQKKELKAAFDPQKEIINAKHLEITIASSESDKNHQIEIFKEYVSKFELALSEANEIWKNVPNTSHLNELTEYLEDQQKLISTNFTDKV